MCISKKIEVHKLFININQHLFKSYESSPAITGTEFSKAGTYTENFLARNLVLYADAKL